MGPSGSWRRLTSSSELVLRFTLENGQCFNWKPLARLAAQTSEERADVDIDNTNFKAVDDLDGGYVGVVEGVPIHLREINDQVQFRVLTEDAEPEHAERLLAEYFQLNVDMSRLHKEWAKKCSRIDAVGKCLPGMRILRQDPFECLISFICSSNNNIARITLMLDRLRTEFGTKAAVLGPSRYTKSKAALNPPLNLYAFPTPLALAKATEQQLRDMGFGYRAKYIVNSVNKLNKQKGGATAWLSKLRAMDQSEDSLKVVREALVDLDGVGPKVADCVALFGLDRRSVIPVDTHVWQIACRDFDRDLLQAKSLTPVIYDRVGCLFRARYGPYAGWAHSVLFAAELPQFLLLLPEDVQLEVKGFAQEEKKRKAQIRQEKLERKQEASSKSNAMSTTVVKEEKQKPSRSCKRREAEPSCEAKLYGGKAKKAETEKRGIASVAKVENAKVRTKKGHGKSRSNIKIKEELERRSQQHAASSNAKQELQKLASKKISKPKKGKHHDIDVEEVRDGTSNRLSKLQESFQGSRDDAVAIPASKRRRSARACTNENKIL
mmetsp:Transcript_9533/g.18830  ORF Transcript_9533/g.18830 Transcript_9533/m.18830 type:complete len:550 (-) Transcript_9533:260-1909(-)